MHSTYTEVQSRLEYVQCREHQIQNKMSKKHMLQFCRDLHSMVCSLFIMYIFQHTNVQNLSSVLHIMCSLLRVLVMCKFVQCEQSHCSVCTALRMLGVRGTGSGGAVCGQ